MNTSNKALGNLFETEFCNLLSKRGFWVHNTVQKSEGQPADVIAVKGKVAYLIDCKYCAGNRFVFSRIEENQHYAMELWKECGNGDGWFAVKMGNDVYMLSHSKLMALSKTKSSLNSTGIREQGITLEGWLRLC